MYCDLGGIYGMDDRLINIIRNNVLNTCLSNSHHSCKTIWSDRQAIDSAKEKTKTVMGDHLKKQFRSAPIQSPILS